MTRASRDSADCRASVVGSAGAVLRRRLPWAALVAFAAAAASVAGALRVEPAYRATTTLRLEGRSLPLDFDPGELSRYTEEELRALRGRVLAPRALARPVSADGDLAAVVADLGPIPADALERIERTRVTDIGAEITQPEGGELGGVSFAFTLTLDDPDPDAAGHALRLAQARFLADDPGARSTVTVPLDELAARRAEVDRLDQTIARLESEIDAFERQNAAGLPELYELNAQAMERADRERAQLDGQIMALEERRIELDRALRDIEREASAGRAGEEVNPLTSQRLTALQSERAVLAGLYGPEHPEARRLGEQIAELQRETRARLDAAGAELRAANEELVQLERIYAIDHPDVVRLAHQVSALESRVDSLTLTGLTTGERRYIEGIAGERRDIDGRLEALRSRQDSLRESVASYESRALEGPLLEQQYATMQEQLVGAKAELDAARARLDEVELQQRIAQQTSPGRLTVVDPVRVRGPLPLTRPPVIVFLGALLAVLAVLVVVLTLERVDRRVSGARRILQLQGAPPLAEIPFIHGPNQPITATQPGLGAQGVVALLGVLSVLVLASALSDRMGRALLGFLGM